MKRLKVAIVTISLKNGGAERSCANLSKMLHNLGFDVHLICINPGIDYDYSGQIFVVKNKPRESLFSYVRSFIRLKKYIKNEGFDYIIDSRTRANIFKELMYLWWFYKNSELFYMVRSSYLDNYLTSSTTIAKKIFSSCKNIITVSNGIKKQIEKKFNVSNCICIENYITPLKVTSTNLDKDYILFLGRINDKVKNISLLLKSYAISKIGESHKLLIVGSGPDYELISNKIKDLNIKNKVIQIPYTTDVGDYLNNAKYLVLTSRYEGFGNVLIEALWLGTPVISVDCDYGPSEIIIHEKNGLLVDNHDPLALADAMRRMVNDTILYSTCKKNAKASIERFSDIIIKEKWRNLINR